MIGQSLIKIISDLFSLLLFSLGLPWDRKSGYCRWRRLYYTIVRLFHPLNSLVFTRNLWLILLSKIQSNIHQKNSRFLIWYVLIFSLASVVAELLASLQFFTNKNYITYLGPMLPPGSRNWQLIPPHWCRFKAHLSPVQNTTAPIRGTSPKLHHCNNPDPTPDLTYHPDTNSIQNSTTIEHLRSSD